jgi:hypothetical protein
MLTQLYLPGRVFLVLMFFAGAAMAGAGVEFKNTATQVVGTVTTNAQRLYTAPLQPQEAEQNTLENLLSGEVATAGRMPRLLSLHIGSDRASGRDVFGVA